MTEIKYTERTNFSKKEFILPLHSRYSPSWQGSQDIRRVQQLVTLKPLPGSREGWMHECILKNNIYGHMIVLLFYIYLNLKFLFSVIGFCLYGCLCTLACTAHECQKRVTDLLELEFGCLWAACGCWEQNSGYVRIASTPISLHNTCTYYIPIRIVRRVLI